MEKNKADEPRQQMNLSDRQFLYMMKQDQVSIRRTADFLDREPSTISRELKKNGPQNRAERRISFWEQAKLAQTRVELRRHRTRGRRFRIPDAAIRKYIVEKLKPQEVNGKKLWGWTPKMISARISGELPGKSISHETIYAWIHFEARHLLYYLIKLSKYKRRKSRSEKLGRKKNFGQQTSKGRPISERPEHVLQNNEFGHVERDCMVSCRGGKAALMNFIERKTRYMFLVKLENLTSAEGRKAAIKVLRDLDWLSTMTNDNGTENGDADWIEIATGVLVYRCDPYSPHQRGINERANGTIRKVLPKGTNFDNITAEDVKIIQDWYNNRPLGVLGYLTPQEALDKELAALNSRVNA